MLEFSTNYSLIFASFFLLVSAAVSYFFYRNSLLIKWKKYLLIALKSLALFLLFMLFIQPVLLSFLGENLPALDIVLIDNSRSINTDRNNNAGEILNLLKKNGNELKLYSFSGNTTALSPNDSLSFQGAATNLTASLSLLKQELAGSRLNSVTIISDGNFNEGGNPLYTAKTFSAPFITVPVSDTIQQKDLMVYNAAYNKTSFINTRVIVKIFIKAFGINRQVNLKLEREGSVVSQKQVNTEENPQIYTAEFELTESNPGKYKYRVSAEQVEGEITYKNNYYDFYIEFIDNKIKMLLISGGPSYDNAAINRIVKRIKNFELITRTLKNQSEFYEGKLSPDDYNSLSAIMLLNFPPANYTGNELDAVYNTASGLKIPVILFAGKNTDYRKLELVQDLIPFTVSQPSSIETGVKLQAVTGTNTQANDIAFKTDNLPELFKNIRGITPKPGAVTLIMDKISGEPVLITGNTGKFNTTAFTAYGFWKWLMNGIKETQVSEIIEGSIKISLNTNRNKNFILTPVKDIFDYTEDVIFQAEVYDENNNPLPGAVVSAVIKKLNGEKIMDAEFIYRDGRYVSNTGKLSCGDYIAEGYAEISGTNFSKDISRFSVDTLNTEYLQTVSDYSALRELANNTGGTFTTIENLNKTISETRNSFVDTDRSYFSRINLRKNLFYLGLVILLFSVEWVLRKRNNIP